MTALLVTIKSDFLDAETIRFESDVAALMSLIAVQEAAFFPVTAIEPTFPGAFNTRPQRTGSSGSSRGYGDRQSGACNVIVARGIRARNVTGIVGSVTCFRGNVTSHSVWCLRCFR